MKPRVVLVDDHARDDQATVTMAADEDGKILAAKVDFLEGGGAFPAAFGSSSVLTTMIFPGPYHVPAYGSSSRTVLTNTGSSMRNRRSVRLLSSLTRTCPDHTIRSRTLL